MERSLSVWINQSLVGVLHENNSLWSFVYDGRWLAAPAAHPLCPLLPLQPGPHHDGATTRPVQWYFDNLLPEEGQRHLIARAAGVAIEDAFSMLAHFGAESAGSITLLPPGQEPQPGSIRPLTYAALSQRIKAMPGIPLAEQAAKKMSLAGAQHKVAIIFQDNQLFEPIGSQPSTHILKPEHPDEAWPHSVINEWYVMTLAARIGLPVPRVYRLYIPQPVYLIERFDRTEDKHGWSRLHCIDACQLDGLSREYKYSAANIERVAALADRCRPAALARLRLYQWLIFNVLVGNEDAHLKNLSFLLSGRSVHLAPFYDLLSTAVYGTQAYNQHHWPERASLAWPINGIQRLMDITAPVLISAGEAMGIKPQTARNTIQNLIDSVRKEAPKLMNEVIQANTDRGRQNPELKATFAGEARMLRTINAIVIREMTEQLGKDL